LPNVGALRVISDRMRREVDPLRPEAKLPEPVEHRDPARSARVDEHRVSRLLDQDPGDLVR
jgi:hypothetical protein